MQAFENPASGGKVHFSLIFTARLNKLAEKANRKEQSAGAATLQFQNGTGQYFGVNPESIHMDFRPKRELASCCVVNLAFAARGGFFCGCG
jgi:hypothetical protein